MAQTRWIIQQINGIDLAGFPGEVVTEIIYECRVTKGDIFRSEHGKLLLQPPSAKDFVPASQVTKELAQKWLAGQMSTKLRTQIEAAAVEGFTEVKAIGKPHIQPASHIVPRMTM